MRFYIKTILIFFIFLFAVTNITGVSAQDWWDSDWGNRKEIDIENVGGSSLSNYTAYIKVIKTNSMQSDYDDLRFVYNGDLLDHEIGYYNDTYCDCYVRIPNFADTGISLYIYYNNPSVSGLDIHKDAWDDNAVRINHMEDAAGTTEIFDSTEYSYPIEQEDVIFEQDGIVSNGFYMTRDPSSYLYRSNNIYFDDEMAFSTWIRTDYSGSDYMNVIGRYYGHIWSYIVSYSDTDKIIKLCMKDNGGSSHDITYTFSPGEFNDDSWHMISGYLDADYMKLYFDGIELNSTNGGFGLYQTLAHQFLHGYIGSSTAYEGYLDETKVFKRNFNEGWHKQEYEIVINQSDVIEFGIEENKPLPSYIFTLPAEDIGGNYATLRGGINMNGCLIWFGWSPTKEKYLFWDKLLYFPEPETEIKYNIYDLLPGVEYKFNIFAFCGNKFYIGNESSFTTTGSLRLN